MAGVVYPREEPRTSNRCEVAVWEALRAKLPDGWTAWHSLRLRHDGGWEGEGDFVIACPRRGLLVLEVKGGMMTCEDGRWLQNGKALKRGPREQAQSFVRHLVTRVRELGGSEPPFGVACMFPDIDFSQGPRAGDLDGLVLGRRDLHYIDEALRSVIGRALPTTGGRVRTVPREDQWVPMLHELWGETWVPHVRLCDRVEDAERRAVALDAEQLRLLDFARSLPRALVRGGAGSGKTVVARKLCLDRARGVGERVLYLCFTDALARTVERSFAGERLRQRDVHAVAVRRHARALLERAGHSVPTTSEAWREVSFVAACDSLPPRAERPSFVVVDEAQDFEDSDWEFVEVLSRDAGLWVFLDERQRFWPERRIPTLCEALPPLVLSEQHRNPPAVRALASLYAGDRYDDERGADIARGIGTELELLAVEQGFEEVTLHHWLRSMLDNGARPRDIAVLSVAGQTRTPLATSQHIGDTPVVRADSDSADASIVADTFLRFKGLERPFVVVMDLHLAQAAPETYEARLHIALTRATSRATIICSRACVTEDERLSVLGAAPG